MEPESNSNSPLGLVVSPPMSREQVLWVSLTGFTLVVGFVLLAAYMGYQGSDRIQDTAQALLKEHLVQSDRGAEVEALIVRETQELIDKLAWVLGLCILLAAGTAGLTIWIIQQAFAKLEWQGAELEHVSWHMIDSNEKTARRFAHEMHDELGQSLSGLRRLLSGNKDCLDIVDEMLVDVRRLSQALRPVILDDFGLDSGLRWLCERFSQRTGIEVEYESNFAGRLAENEETHLFRIAQEALTNIARHSEAKQAWISLKVEGQRVALEIADNGQGLRLGPKNKSASLGMVGMRARARQLGGELIVENRKEGGLRVKAEVPCQKPDTQVEQDDPSFVG